MCLLVEDNALSYFAVMVLHVHHVGHNKLHDETLRSENFIYLFPLF